MATLSSGIYISKVYADNNALGGGTEADFDGDGNPGGAFNDAANSDEFITLTNNSASSVDISGYELFSSGVAYHTFPPGTVLGPGKSISVITNYNDPAGTPSPRLQQANGGNTSLDPRTDSAFGVTDTIIADNANGSGFTNSAITGGDATVALFNGDIASASEGLLVTWEPGGAASDPANYNGGGANGFSGTLVDTLVVPTTGNFPDADINILFDTNGNQTTGAPEFPCIGRGTLIETHVGKRRIEFLRAGDLVATRDHGLQKILWIGSRVVEFTDGPDQARPIVLRAGCVAPGIPCEDLQLSPQHRVPVATSDGAAPGGDNAVLGPAQALTILPGVRVQHGCRSVEYFTILLERHAVIFANDLAVESFYPGPWGMNMIGARNRSEVVAAIPGAERLGAAKAYGETAFPALTFRKMRETVDARGSHKRLMPSCTPSRESVRYWIRLWSELRADHAAQGGDANDTSVAPAPLQRDVLRVG